jgi:hypothetical protein
MSKQGTQRLRQPNWAKAVGSPLWSMLAGLGKPGSSASHHPQLHFLRSTIECSTLAPTPFHSTNCFFHRQKKMRSSVTTATVPPRKPTGRGFTVRAETQEPPLPSETKHEQDFFWTYTEEPHRTRRMAIIKAHPEVCSMAKCSADLR